MLKLEKIVEQDALQCCKDLMNQPMILQHTFSTYITEYFQKTFELLSAQSEILPKSQQSEQFIIYACRKLCETIVYEIPAFSSMRKNCRYGLSEHISDSIRDNLYCFSHTVKQDSFRKSIESIVTSCYPIKDEILYDGEKLENLNAICRAIATNDINKTNSLIDTIDVNAHNNRLLLTAISLKKIKSVKILIEKGSDVSSYYYMPLIMSLKESRYNPAISNYIIDTIKDSDNNIVFDLTDITFRHRYNPKIEILEKIHTYKNLNQQLVEKHTINRHKI